MSLRKFSVRHGAGTYNIWIGGGARHELPTILGALGEPPSRVHLVTDAIVAELHAMKLLKRLAKSGFIVSGTIVPPGEKSKSVRVLERLWRDMIRAGCNRETVVLALGGGVVGDLAGFAAASLLRGVRFVQVPTTLLAMVDASVGGKTGINVPEGKNLVGAFHQPAAVVMDLDFLRTLPPRELRAGWAEVLKTAAIIDRGLLRKLEQERRSLLSGNVALVGAVVERSARIKAQVVGADERESGLRMILNFGHTLGHAIEAVEGYGGLLHGEAVAVGMVFAARLGEALGITAKGTAARLEDLIRSYGLPTNVRGIRVAPVLKAMGRDKKRGAKGLRWVLLERLGRTQIVDTVSSSVVEEELKMFLQGGKP